MHKKKTMDYSELQVLFSEFCFDHFQHNDTANDEKFKTPLNSKDNSPNGNESESIEVVDNPSNACEIPLQESTISSASTSNTDICVLDSHYASDIQFLPDNDDELSDEFIESEDGDDVFLRVAEVMDKNEDFTVLQKPTTSHRMCNCEESTEVLMLINSEYQEKRNHAYSGTDSDVEVLMSEEIIGSDWSSGNGPDENAKDSTLQNNSVNVLKLNPNSDLKDSSPSCLQQSFDGHSFKTQASTDLDVSGEELVDANIQNDKYHNFNRMQLLDLIKRQEVCIQALEATVERYQKSQQRLFEHVDALRLELSEIRITPFQIVESSEKQ